MCALAAHAGALSRIVHCAAETWLTLLMYQFIGYVSEDYSSSDMNDASNNNSRISSSNRLHDSDFDDHSYVHSMSRDASPFSKREYVMPLKDT
jgi:hypothetical protein